jgi:hypothetical protein
MFMQPEGAEKKPGLIPVASQWAIGATLAGTIGLGIIPTGFLNYATQSVDAMRAVFGG